MRILPVLDLLDGVVVRGVAGRRSEYRPIQSQLTARCDAMTIAQTIRSRFELSELYVADLDGILKQQPNLRLLTDLIDDGFELLVDAGFGRPADIQRMRETGVKQFIVGLETCLSPDDLQVILDLGIDVTFSLDLDRGMPRRHVASQGWRDDPENIARQVVQRGVSSILVLDLADVGMATGGTTESLSRQIKALFPDVRLLTGGGVRGIDDLRGFAKVGVDTVLVASALHDGKLTRCDILECGSF